MTMFSESVILEIQNLRRSFFRKESSKFNLRFKNVEKNREKDFFSEIISSELVSLSCPYEEQDTCHRQQCFNKKS